VQIPYSIREGIAGFRRAKFATFASTSAMTVALILMGMFGLAAFEAQQVSDWLRQRVGEVELFLSEKTEEQMADVLNQRAATMPGVDETEYVSQEEAQQVFEREFGEGAEIYFDDPFLPASIKVRVQSDYANPDSLSKMVDEFRSWNRVDEVVFNRPLLVKVQRNLRLITFSGFALGLLVIVASIFLVGNTIRLTIYARRLLIRTMKLVGATDAFVRRPFLVEGMAQGVIAGLISGGIVGLFYRLLADYLPQLQSAALPLGWVTAGVLVGVGIVLGWLGSFFAVRRFIKNVPLH
jgi:cell division transport system permease protein